MLRDATDALIARIDRASTGREPWEEVLAAVARACDAFAVQLLAIDKQASTLSSSTALFSHVAGSARPEYHLDYLRKYQHVDPRALLTCLFHAPPTVRAVAAWSGPRRPRIA